ncbi:MAG: 5'/3'-nucleotidase SurE [Chloroflexota bacterium]|nr:5'/3'-nucleotidase SurE [Chloroflexota bacterium]|tara:strand:- start:994 stop:1773 length:780 start_codon:yes stop_codon:yes gene_type:complete
MNILVTNDDGFENPGIWALAKAVKSLGEVTVVAPVNNQSGTGCSISFRKSVNVEQVPSKLERVNCYAVSGTPADSVILGSKYILKEEVDVVVSGINPGFNTSRNMFISGTFGAAIIASSLGLRACAFSMDAMDPLNDLTVANVVKVITDELMSPETPLGSLFNVNFPTISLGGINGIEGCAPARSDLKMNVDLQSDGGHEIFSELKINADNIGLTPGSDIEVLARGKVAITAVDGSNLNYLRADQSLHRMIDAANRVIG